MAKLLKLPHKRELPKKAMRVGVDEQMSEIADRIRQCAVMLGSVAELSRSAGVPRRTLDNYLIGKNEPKLSALIAIADAAGVTLDWLMRDDASGLSMEKSVEVQADVNVDPIRLAAVLEAVEAGIGTQGSAAKVADVAARVYNQIFDIEDDTEWRGAMKVTVRRELRALES